MFSFTHTVEELRDLVQCMEARIASMQAHVQKLVQQANEQQQAMTPPPQTPVVDSSSDQPQS
jgi:uncharacterized coiled-coil protein SlyX